MVEAALNFIRKNKVEFTILCLIILTATFFRFYKIDQYMTFLGDEGRDALVIRGILVDHHIPLIGPPTSVGNMYLGPLYYYMMVPPMMIFWMNPVAAAGMVALVGVLSVIIIYYLARVWFGTEAAVLAATLYTFSPITITYSRSSWNPNPAPFFALLAILGFFKAHRSGNFLWMILTGAAVAATLQMHYLALILLPTFGLLWLYELILLMRGKLQRRNFLTGTVLGILAFLIIISPLFFFDLRHGFMNYKAITSFFFGKGSSVSFNPLEILSSIPRIYFHDLIGRYLAVENRLLSAIISILVLIPLLIAVYLRVNGKSLRWVFLCLGVWLVVGIFGLALYRSPIYDHYLGFMNPTPFLLLGGLIYYIGQRWKKVVVACLLVLLVLMNLTRLPLLQTPANELQRTQQIAHFVIAKSKDKPFNFALLSKNNYDSAYQFYLEQYGHAPLKVPENKTDQLFVVCEDQECQPINNPKYEIAAFGWATIETEQNFDGVKVFKLIHNVAQPKI